MAKRRTRRSNVKAKNVGKGAIAIIVAAVIAIAVCIVGFITRDDNGKWFRKWKWSSQEQELEKPASWGIAFNERGDELDENKTYNLPRGLTFAALYDSGLINQLDMPAPTVTVTCSHNFEYNNVFVDWIIETANGDEVDSSIITITPTTNGSLTATITCYQAFEQQLTVKAISRDASKNEASCKVDYVRRITSVNKLLLGGSDFGDYFGFQMSNPVLTKGTVYGDSIYANVTLTIKDTFINAFKSYLKFDVKVKDYTTKIELLKNDSLYENNSDKFFSWDMFIEDFDNLDQPHKEAIYYAWYTAYKVGHYAGNGNVLIDFTASLRYNGVDIQKNIIETDYMYMYNVLSGDCDGGELSPNLTLNQNYVI